MAITESQPTEAGARKVDAFVFDCVCHIFNFDKKNAIGPPGVPERRQGQDPWQPEPDGRPKRIADDLAWLRQAYDEPEENGLSPLEDTAAVAAWHHDEDCSERLVRLRDRNVLDAAGFLLHHENGNAAVADSSS